MAIIVHHLENSRSQRILWMLEELGLAYEVKRYARDPKTMLAPPELKQVHPLGKSPLLEHDGRIVAETATIIEYLIALSGGPLGPPEDADGALRWRYFLDYAEGSLMPPLLLSLVIAKMGPFGWPARGFVSKMAMTHIDYVETELGRHPWFAGAAFSAADIMMSFPLEAARQRLKLDGRRPAIVDWLGRIHARPAYQAALEKGGPYAYA
ncbi:MULTISPECIES: glutathione S-transferase family protein [unclassified Sphingomonas]|uniref:glutathione S-transferase family protein n=1 Tax=unclassified Sphingomonas TaxID=196159 RepID=UPI0006F431E0|nr:MULTISPECIES: glutathione S-transferase [unclassified Sphingomonas]KQX18333.1 glutathione S-transferase [Sphingomonas sp. Root1294]KQY72340.1 glutathione S-transferase [Sphingomonas sp. Root50]KRB94387.1 glutathione S-transferase [Sphingomonas sp. Root720]